MGMATAHDGELLGRYLEGGDEDAFRALAERHGPMVLAVCRRLARANAEDAAQATFLALAKKAARLEKERDVGPWLYRAAVLSTRAALRAAGRRRRAEEAAMQERPRARTSTPEAEAARRELAGHLDSAVMSLSPRCREAFVLCHLEGLSRNQAAERLGVPAGTIADRCARGLARMRERLSRRGVTLSAAGLTAALTAESAQASAQFASVSLVPSVLAAASPAAGAGVSANVVGIADAALRSMVLANARLIATFAGAALLAVAAVPAAGLMLREERSSGFSDSVVYSGRHRNPAAVLTTGGTLLVFADHRPNMAAGSRDSLVLKRSTDGGRTWSTSAVFHREAGVRVGDPCPVVDRRTGTVWLLFARDNARAFVTCSRDEGLSWDVPRALAGSVRAVGPGRGIQLSSGRLLAPAFDGNGKGAFCFYSDDGGKSWQRGGSVGRSSGMSALVELADGSVYLNARRLDVAGRPRPAAFSRDGGLTWEKIAPEAVLPRVDCRMSLARLAQMRGGRPGAVLFCGPAGSGRRNLTVYTSYDECQTWKACRLLRKGPAGYSDMVVFPDGSVGCAYESSDPRNGSIRLARFTPEWLGYGKFGIDSGARRKKDRQAGNRIR
jgi:sialidase-1